MSNINEKYQIIENAIVDLGLDPATCREQKAGQWTFKRGSATIAVGVLETEKFPQGYFYTNSILLTDEQVADDRRNDLFKVLMEENAFLVDMKLCYKKPYFMLNSNRSAVGLDKEEVSNVINVLSAQADLLDDMIINFAKSRVNS